MFIWSMKLLRTYQRFCESQREIIVKHQANGAVIDVTNVSGEEVTVQKCDGADF